MNFWIASLFYHCTCPKTLFKEISVLFKFLELNKIYTFANLEKHTNVLRELLKAHLKVINHFVSFLGEELRLQCIDLYFCLLCDKIPINSTGFLLLKIYEFGWFFFYRVVLLALKQFEKKYWKELKQEKYYQDLKVEWKLFMKDHVNWEAVLLQAEKFKIKDELIENKLDWEYKGLFKIPLKK